jgi:general transcription factor 3C polypeptide 3 (transcription factor C subunit 4)
VIDKKALPSMTMDEDNDSDAEEGDMTMPSGSATFKPTKINPTFLMLYGHAMASGKSYQSAIGGYDSFSRFLLIAFAVYYLRAYDLRQDDPLICLSLAMAYLHRSMQRQSDNRHYHLAQALAFLDGYRKHCENEEELQYNFGRVFHHLGILDLAVKHYENVLARADERIKDPPMQLQGEEGILDLSKEAAYNLSIIYYTRNAPELARDVVSRYLSV